MYAQGQRVGKPNIFFKAFGARKLEGLNRIAKHFPLLFNHRVKLFKDGVFIIKMVIFIFVVGYKYCLHNLIVSVNITDYLLNILYKTYWNYNKLSCFCIVLLNYIGLYRQTLSYPSLGRYLGVSSVVIFRACIKPIGPIAPN